MKEKGGNTYIFGTHPVREALTRVPHAVRHAFFVGDLHHDLELLAQEKNIPFDRCDERNLPRGLDRDATHQGAVCAVSPAKVLVDYAPFIENLHINEKTGLVLLNEIEDPHNVGAIIRNAAAFGIAGVLLPEHRQATVSGTVVKVSAGMAFTLPLVRIGNVNTVVRDLKKRGFWIYGLSAEGKSSLPKEKFTKPSVFVFGNEGRGMREKTEEVCDFTLSIPLAPRCESLNVASSAGVTLYAWRTSVGK
jgi:23S rRNA (guanosine2251-2'-O)-methyltransferase